MQELRKQEHQAEYAITPAKEAKILLPAPFSHIHSKMIRLPLICLHLSLIGSIWLPSQTSGVAESTQQLPMGGDNLRCWYIALVF